MYRGLRIPATYLPTSGDDATNTVADGKVGVALIQEHRFNQYCMRLQSLVASTMDAEFKLFLRWRGVNIDNSIFDIEFNEPQNFATTTTSPRNFLLLFTAFLLTATAISSRSLIAASLEHHSGNLSQSKRL